MINLKHFILLFSLAIATSCSSNKKNEQAKTPEENTEKQPKKASLTKIWETDTLLTTCESVLYDKSRDVLYVANIGNVPPNAKDGDGFISKVSTTGEILTERWVEDMDAPKGMGLVGSTLYVTNIDELIAIDVTTGSISKRYPVANAQFLNDITVSANGEVFCSDSNTNTIHQLKDGKVSVWLKNDDLGGPNGLLHQGSKLTLATFGQGNFKQIDTNTKNITLIADSTPGGDGVVAVGSDYLVSNWNGEVYHISSNGSTTKLLDTKAKKLNAADIEYIASSQTLLIPTFFGNTVAAYKVSL